MTSSTDQEPGVPIPGDWPEPVEPRPAGRKAPGKRSSAARGPVRKPHRGTQAPGSSDGPRASAPTGQGPAGPAQEGRLPTGRRKLRVRRRRERGQGPSPTTVAVYITIAFIIGLAIGLALLAWDHALMKKQLNEAKAQSAVKSQRASAGIGPASEPVSSIERLFGGQVFSGGRQYASTGIVRAINAWFDPEGRVWGPAPEGSNGGTTDPGGVGGPDVPGGGGTGTGGGGGAGGGGTGTGGGGGAGDSTGGGTGSNDPGPTGDPGNTGDSPYDPGTPSAGLQDASASVTRPSAAASPHIGFTVHVTGAASWVELRVQRISGGSYSTSVRLERASVAGGIETWTTDWKPPAGGTYRYTPVIYQGALARPGTAQTVVVN